MSDITNVITKQKQMYYNAGVNSTNVGDAVESLSDQAVSISYGSVNFADYTNTANVAVVAPFAAKLKAAYFVTDAAVLNTAADEILMTISCNGNAAGTYNSNASADGALAAGGIHTFSLTAANAAVAAGEKITIAATAETVANQAPYGILTFLLQRQ